MKFKIQELPLSKISFLNILATALVFSLAFGFFSIKNTEDYYENRVQLQEQQYIKKNKKLVKDEVLSVIERIKTLKDINYNIYKERLEEKTLFAYNLLNSKHSEVHTTKELISIYKKTFDNLTWDDKTGYLYIFDNKGVLLYHGSNEKYVNKSLFDLAKDNKDLQEFIKDTIKKDENHGKYDWYKPYTDINKQYKKYVFAKKIDKLNIYVAAGMYKDELQKKVQKIIFSELEKERFGDGDYGYFWINSTDYKMLLHPDKSLIGIDLEKFKTLDGQYLFKNIDKLLSDQKSSYISYIWHRDKTPDVADEKISYVHLIDDWDMVIGSGFYLSELQDMLIAEKEILRNSLYNNLINYFILISVLVVLSILSALFVSKKIDKIERSQKEHFNMLKQYKLVLDKSAVVSRTDPNGIITYVNNGFCKVSGFSKNEVIGKAHTIVRHPESPKSQFKSLWRNIQNGKVWKGVIKNKNKNNGYYFNSTTIVPIKDSEGKIIEYISAGTNVTELIDNRVKLKSIASTDALTGLNNRVSLINTISKYKNAVLALINIDRFKEINDTQGHEVGDLIIKELGNRLFNFLDDSKYTVYRVQADIFAVYTTKVDEADVVETMHKFINSKAKEAYICEDNNIILTYTVGIAKGDENIFTYADIALSEAKNKKAVIKTYDSSMKNIDEYKQNIIWVEKLYKALTEDNIRPYFQPIYNYHTKKIEKYECLMRLLENGEVVYPGEYLDVAKKTKLYPELTYKMAEKAIDKFSKIDLEFSINLGVEDLMNEELINFIYEYAKKHKVFKKLVLEVVESEEIEDSEFISKIITKFKKQGVRIAIDDFGSGYSNYDYLISLQADYVKIDGSIIKHVLEDERTAEVIKSIVNFAKKSNMKTIAEFVSSEDISKKMEELGVDYAQGFYYGKAEPELL